MVHSLKMDFLNLRSVPGVQASRQMRSVANQMRPIALTLQSAIMRRHLQVNRTTKPLPGRAALELNEGRSCKVHPISCIAVYTRGAGQVLPRTAVCMPSLLCRRLQVFEQARLHGGDVTRYSS